MREQAEKNVRAREEAMKQELSYKPAATKKEPTIPAVRAADLRDKFCPEAARQRWLAKAPQATLAKAQATTQGEPGAAAGSPTPSAPVVPAAQVPTQRSPSPTRAAYLAGGLMGAAPQACFLRPAPGGAPAARMMPLHEMMATSVPVSPGPPMNPEYARLMARP